MGNKGGCDDFRARVKKKDFRDGVRTGTKIELIKNKIEKVKTAIEKRKEKMESKSENGKRRIE